VGPQGPQGIQGPAGTAAANHFIIDSFVGLNLLLVTNQTLGRAGVAAITSVQAPRAGSVTGISVTLSAVLVVGGAVTVQAMVNGAAVAVTAAVAVGGTRAFATVADGTVPFASGDFLGARVTTSGLAVAISLEVCVEVATP
jgi:hypothetical protein